MPTLGEQTGVFFGTDSEFVVKTVVPNIGHFFPVIDYSVLDRVVQLQHSFFCQGLLANIYVFVLQGHILHVLGISNY